MKDDNPGERDQRYCGPGSLLGVHGVRSHRCKEVGTKQWAKHRIGYTKPVGLCGKKRRARMVSIPKSQREGRDVCLGEQGVVELRCGYYSGLGR